MCDGCDGFPMADLIMKGMVTHVFLHLWGMLAVKLMVLYTVGALSYSLGSI